MVIEKVKKDNLGEEVLQLYLNAKRLGHEALQTLRDSNLLRVSPDEADRIAIEGLNRLKQRYTSNNMRIKFLVFNSSPTEMSSIYWPQSCVNNGISFHVNNHPETKLAAPLERTVYIFLADLAHRL